MKKAPMLIVAIGASSGGLEAITELLRYLPADTGMAFIFIQHLSPDYESLLTSLLAKSTTMKVQEIEDMEHMKPDNIYVIPHNKGIEVTNGHIRLLPRAKGNSPNLSIDVLFTSLAKTHKHESIGVVLSGNASDGTIGLKAIKKAGGITFAQDFSAKYRSMPESAINEGVADFVLSPKEIALELTRLSHYAYKKTSVLNIPETKLRNSNPDLKLILQLLLKETGVDFNHYKMNTIKRRILRRLFLYKLPDLKSYIKELQSKEGELQILYDDLLINYTDFFRDANVTVYLKNTVLPALLKKKSDNNPLRVWVLACSTGQEAYSLAILLLELLGEKKTKELVQIFATDLSEQSIRNARLGEYSKADVKSVSDKRLKNFFTPNGNTYRINKVVRDLCTFAPHNVLSNPPFSKIDFISCCNLMIYLDPEIQKRVLNTFHYALKENGILMLGKAESIGNSKLFSQTEREYKIFRRQGSSRNLPDLTGKGKTSRKPLKPSTPRKQVFIQNIESEPVLNEILFTRYLPTCVLVNEAFEIQQFKGDSSKYFEHATGKASLNILQMARPEIAFELRDSLHKVLSSKKELNRSHIELRFNNQLLLVSFDVIPVEISEELFLLIVFKEQEKHGPDYGAEASAEIKKAEVYKKLRAEIAALRNQLTAVNSEKEKAYMVLQEINEEILSSNEEFQCMNEELETSKEEIESANEELQTSNQELQTRNDQLAAAYEFSDAIVNTLHEPMLILDKDLRIKSVNKAFYTKFQLLQSNTEGKYFSELGSKKWNTPELHKLLREIIKKDVSFHEYEMSVYFPHSGSRTILLNARRIVQKTERDQLLLLAFTDITETAQKRKAEKAGLQKIINEKTAAIEQNYRQLQEKNNSLMKMNKELETFTFLSSHDLQEPLRKIKNFAVCLINEEQEALTDSGKLYLLRMQETVIRMQKLIEDLLAYSRVKNTILSFEKTDLAKLIREVISDFKEITKENNGELIVDGKGEAFVIRFQIRQLLYNLISNSLKFVHARRPARISLKVIVKTAQSLKNDDLIADRKYCHISISDNGIGFDPRYKEQIFEVFQRLHEYEEYKGTGIGLAICKRIVENHHGLITANSRVNRGARFDIYLPVEIIHKENTLPGH